GSCPENAPAPAPAGTGLEARAPPSPSPAGQATDPAGVGRDDSASPGVQIERNPTSFRRRGPSPTTRVWAPMGLHVPLGALDRAVWLDRPARQARLRWPDTARA